MRWLKRKTRSKSPAATVPDLTKPGPYAAFWWVPGCTCHWSAGVDCDYCDYCVARWAEQASTPPGSRGDA